MIAYFTILLIGLQVGVTEPSGVSLTRTVATMPGREEDARVAEIAFRLANAGRARCPATLASSGILLQHLTQFNLGDRAGVVAAWPLNYGAGVMAVVAGGPAAIAGIRVGDVLIAIDGSPLPPEPGLASPFDAARAQAYADTVDDLLASQGLASVTLLRAGTTFTALITPRPACPSRVRLARSTQRNAYADGRHVLVTTGLLAKLRGDDELAFVLAHEMAHNILGHAAVMRGGSVARGIGRTLGQSGRVVRGAERDADALGAQLMLDAGYDPVAGAGALVRLGRGDLGLFDDHDGAATRIAAIRARAAVSADR